MGISFFLIWNKSGEVNIKIPVLFFILQLIFNFFWSVIFFGLKMPGLAFIDILVLSALILICIIVFYSISNTASYLLIPYFLWVCFASLLNYKIWTLNF
jgi:tryptophan-rich sensory protein